MHFLKMCFVKISENILLHAKLVNLVSGQSRVRVFLIRLAFQTGSGPIPENCLQSQFDYKSFSVVRLVRKKNPWLFVENLVLSRGDAAAHAFCQQKASR